MMVLSGDLVLTRYKKKSIWGEGNGDQMNKIEEAKQYVINNVIEPALNSDLPVKFKNKAKHAKIWINQFERIGDLISYLKRFKAENNDLVFITFQKYKLKTFEDIVILIEEEYGFGASDKTNSEHFVVGRTYNSHQILIFARTYDTRSGGMFVLGNNEAMIIKATLHGGQYPNAWLQPHKSLKYYLKSIKGKYSENYKENAAVINFPGMPIYTFLRDKSGDDFIFEGTFFFTSLHQNEDNSKWFRLDKASTTSSDVVDEGYDRRTFEYAVAVSKEDTTEARMARLKMASKLPYKFTVITTAYRRNPDVVAEILNRARGICEGCNQKAPFIRRSDDSPYLEVHHKIKLSDNGEDTIENSLALCPNCHRRCHFG